MPESRSTPRPSSGGRRRSVRPSGGGKAIALYHAVYAHEGFEDAARAILEITRKAAQEYPGQPRLLYVDIDGHRNAKGGFDSDMYEL
jgi:hypothetical protein